MAKTLTAADRKALIRLASTMPVGSGERKAILAGLSKTSAQQDLSDYKVGDKVRYKYNGVGKVTEVTSKGLSIEWPNGDESHPSVGSAMLTKDRGIMRLGKTSSLMGRDFLTSFVDHKKYRSTLRTLNTDEQSQDLLQQVRGELVDRLTPDSSTERALNRLSNLVSGNQDPANLRNQIFKVANELGMKLPSGMF